MRPSAQSILETEVRELVRRRGIDPIAEPLAVAGLIEDVLGEYRDRSITSALPPLGDVVAVTGSLLDSIAGFGVLQPMLDDPSVDEIWISWRLTDGSRSSAIA